MTEFSAASNPRGERSSVARSFVRSFPRHIDRVKRFLTSVKMNHVWKKKIFVALFCKFVELDVHDKIYL